jgi:hypothetical protein
MSRMYLMRLLGEKMLLDWALMNIWDKARTED